MSKYKLTVSVYNNPTVSYTKTYDTFEEGIIYAEFASELLTSTNILHSRHSSCEGVFRHMDKYFDLYNEGEIILSI